jgi:hypothetical protein
LSQRVRALGDCSDRIAFEKSERAETVVEVVNALLTKTTTVRRKVRSEYTERYEDFCRGGDKVKPSSSEFWEAQLSQKGSSLNEKHSRRGEPVSLMAGSVFRQLSVTEPREVRAPALHHPKDNGILISNDPAARGDAGLQGDSSGHPPKSPARRPGSSPMSVGPNASARRRPSHSEDSKVLGREGSPDKATESCSEETAYEASFRRFISTRPCPAPEMMLAVLAAVVCRADAPLNS